MKHLLVLAAFLFHASVPVFGQTNPQKTGGSANDPKNIQPLTDQIPPVVSCLNNLVLNLLPGGVSSISVNDLLQGLSDNQTPPYQIKLGIRLAALGAGFPFDANGNPVQNIQFNCHYQGQQLVELWAMDLAGNTDFSQCSIVIQDGAFHCDSNPTVTACAGTGACGLEDILYHVSGESASGAPLSLFFIKDGGCTDFHIPYGSSGKITPFKDDDPLTGVSMYDWSLVQKHLAGTDTFTSPYQWIAADINGDRVLDIQDSIDFRRTLLGIYLNFPSNQSWRFVPADYQFPWPNPLSQPFPESYEFDHIHAADSVRFIAVKIGDVNLSALCDNAAGEATDRNRPVDNQVEYLLSPNPTNGQASLEVSVPAGCESTLQLRDFSGKLCFESQQWLKKGKQRLEIPASAMPAGGIYFWQLDMGEKTVSGKLIRN